MSMSEPSNTNDLAYEKLVAYLDGELDAESSQQVERRLAEDPGYRHELKQMQRAWDLLDELPRAEVSETFTQTTVEMVALSAEHELKECQEPRAAFRSPGLGGGGGECRLGGSGRVLGRFHVFLPSQRSAGPRSAGD